MVISVRTVWEVQPWDVSGGGAGYGSKERSKGRECVIFLREWDPLNRQGGDEGGRPMLHCLLGSK